MRKKTESPKIIYLQYYAEHPEEKTWCEDSINSGDVCYVRAGIADELAAALEAIIVAGDYEQRVFTLRDSIEALAKYRNVK